MKVSPLAIRRLRICEACEFHVRKGCRCRLYNGGKCVKGYADRPGAVCPDDPPRWLPAIEENS